MRTLEQIEEYINEAMETRTVHPTECATLMLDLVLVVKHDIGNLQQQIEHLKFLIDNKGNV